MTIEKILDDCANTIRQQAKEIGMLKQIIDANNLQSDIGQFIKPIDKPVAWISVEPVAMRYDFDGYGYMYIDSGSGSDWQTREKGEFLYIHPIRELTDEEIESEWFKVFKPETGIGKNITNGIYDFARAILKKASEK